MRIFRCSSPEGVSAQGGVYPEGVPGGVWPGGCLPRVYLPGGGVSQHALRQTPPLWTEFLTHACENITLLQLRYGR